MKARNKRPAQLEILSVRLPHETLTAIDAYAEKLKATETNDPEITRGVVGRILITYALRALGELPGKVSK